MISVARTDRSYLGQWWLTVDRWSMAGIFGLMAFGLILIMAASPSQAHRWNVGDFHFVMRQLSFAGVGVVLMVSVSMLRVNMVGALAWFGFAVAFAAMLIVPFVGPEIKGAQRWLRFAGMSVQPSEFAKLFFAVAVAWLLAAAPQKILRYGLPASALLFALLALCLAMQRDFGTIFMIAIVWGALLFLAGTSLWILGGLGGLAVIGGLAVYQFQHHVRLRVDQFLFDTGGDRWQIDRALESFRAGGLVGRGPGEGVVKARLPDAHTDFIFAVAGEEFGLIACALLLGTFVLLAYRGFERVNRSRNLFIFLSASGLLLMLLTQCLINVAVNLELMPTKGTTLPFVSYGGSSLLACSIGAGMLLALTRRRPAAEESV